MLQRWDNQKEVIMFSANVSGKSIGMTGHMSMWTVFFGSSGHSSVHCPDALG
jgi:hypothetical protein